MERKDQILERWKRTARTTTPAAAKHPDPVLANALPSFLDRLAQELGRDEVPDAWPASDTTVPALAAEHGRQRALLTDYSLPEVVREYQLLARVLLSVLEAEAPLQTDVRDALLGSVFSAVRFAVAEFDQLRSREREEARLALEQANAHLARAVDERTRELQRGELVFRKLVEGVRDYAILLLDGEGRVTSWNSGAERMNGYTPEEALGRDISLLYPEGGRKRNEPSEHLRIALKAGRFRGEGMRQRKNGELYLADVLITPLYDGDAHVGFSKLVQDLSERQRLLQELDLSRSLGERLRVEAEAKDRYVALLTHDLRNPLAAAANYLNLILLAPDRPDRTAQAARGIQKALGRMERMIVDLLDAAQVQAGEALQMEFAPCDLGQLATQSCEEARTHHPERIELLTKGDLCGVWNADGLRRVIDNLLSNALKYSEPGSKVTVRVRRGEQRVYLSVHNLGAVIGQADQAELFEPFRRSATAQGTRGWGLGLTLVRGIVQAHGGMVKVESYPEEGTTFTVDLPVRPERAPVASAQ
jgi:PAS domain S-box-containing protein